MTEIIPTVGRVVWYRLEDCDVHEIHKRRTYQWMPYQVGQAKKHASEGDGKIPDVKPEVPSDYAK